jgi:hypothetical protein
MTGFDRRLQIDAIMGSLIPQGGIIDITEFDGNQYNESWRWKRSELEKKSDQYLLELYLSLKRHEDKLFEQFPSLKR